MRCFTIYDEDKNDEPRTKRSTLVRSSTSSSTEHDSSNSSSVSNSQNASVVSTESPARISLTNLSQGPNDLRIFTYEELKAATRSFSRSLMVGEGGFGGVYRGVIRETDKMIDIAVKQLSRRGFQGHKEWVTEVNVLGYVEHPNLVKLVGYCAEDDERGIQRLLVYEYMPNNSVQDHLSGRLLTTLPWATRLRIARDAACGLAYLHEGFDFQIIFRDFKSSNILLDEQWNAKLSDFGLAKLGPSNGLSHVSTAVVGTVGYTAPEYVQTGRLTSKSDVWSYGVFLYELITGRRPMDHNRPKNERRLLDWVRPHLSDWKKFENILDPRLEGNYSLDSALKLAVIANRCLARQPKERPKMSKVFDIVNRVLETAEIGSCPQDPPIRRSIVADIDERSVSECLKERFVDGDYRNRWLVCLPWTLKLIKAT